MPYTAARPVAVPSSDELRRRIPGWGADLDPADRPSVPRLQAEEALLEGVHDLPVQQPELVPRERSIEHARLTPVFGTSCPLHGASGAIRRLAYARFSEGRAAHWLLLLVADRVDAAGSHLRSLASLHPDNPLTETGVLGELRHHPWRSRVHVRRSDVKHQWIDPLIVAGPWLLSGFLARRAVRRVRRR